LFTGLPVFLFGGIAGISLRIKRKVDIGIWITRFFNTPLELKAFNGAAVKILHKII
jgi:hypothetical protein